MAAEGKNSTSSCCPSTLPAVITHNYKPKGQWEKFADLDVYTTTTPSSTPPNISILCIYDIFGPIPQTIQGCDMLSTALNATVYMPDLFQGSALPLTSFPLDTDAKKEEWAKFKEEKSGIEVNVGRVRDVVAAVKEKDRNQAQGREEEVPWGGYGMCWGAKILLLASLSTPSTSNPNTTTPLFPAGIAQVHPSSLSLSNITPPLPYPMLVLFSSRDGDPNLVKSYAATLLAQNPNPTPNPNPNPTPGKGKGKMNQVEFFSEMPHGWMGGRADLESPGGRAGFERGYAMLAAFFGEGGVAG